MRGSETLVWNLLENFLWAAVTLPKCFLQIRLDSSPDAREEFWIVSQSSPRLEQTKLRKNPKIIVSGSLQHQRFCQPSNPLSLFAFSLIISHFLVCQSNHGYVWELQKMYTSAEQDRACINYFLLNLCRTKWINRSRQETAAPVKDRGFGISMERWLVLGERERARARPLLISKEWAFFSGLYPIMLWCHPPGFVFSCSCFCCQRSISQILPRLPACLSAGVVMRQHPLW